MFEVMILKIQREREMNVCVLLVCLCVGVNFIPYLLSDLVKVKELAMLYAETCFWTRATSELSVT